MAPNHPVLERRCKSGTGRGTPLVPHRVRAVEILLEAEERRREIARNDPDNLPPDSPEVIAIQERAICENPDAGPDGVGVREDGLSYTLEARTVPQAVALAIRAAKGYALFRAAAALRDLAARGMSPRKYRKEAERLEKEAESL